jgi:uncharacterized surface protein with fasciclin (FAS1) repeats
MWTARTGSERYGTRESRPATISFKGSPEGFRNNVKEEVILVKNIVETAMEVGSLKTLVESLRKAGLTEVLSGKGPFTVFAPDDGAFAKLPKETLDEVSKDRERLASVLKYHVIPIKIMSKDIFKRDSIETVQGSKILLDVSSGITVNEAKVVKTDIECKNGVIHVIDSVLLP